ncbi:hypothetical protein INT47_011210 [Mucor saturninus]|uniref:Uncharacterized protein n=1 Tax=Mucor saturninus TaxID=64648 RepID=A0A8H7RNQ7_9FUNG|nr:hypothetical protein INT47_011210 [Mucor saturninus]
MIIPLKCCMSWPVSTKCTGKQEYFVDTMGQMFDYHNCELDRFLELINNNTSTSVLTENIKNAQARNTELKRKYAEVEDDYDSSELESESTTATATATTIATATSSQQIQSTSSLSYEKGMKFVEQFKQARMEKGLTKMDWLTCLAEGRKRNLLDYKNSSTFGNQSAKDIKKYAD